MRQHTHTYEAEGKRRRRRAACANVGTVIQVRGTTAEKKNQILRVVSLQLLQALSSSKAGKQRVKSLPRERLSRALSRVVSLARALSRVVSLHLRLLLLQGSVSICTFVRVKRVPGAASVAGGLRQCLCFCTSTTSKLSFTALLPYCCTALMLAVLLVYWFTVPAAACGGGA
jgi:hypothetical protein